MTKELLQQAYKALEPLSEALGENDSDITVTMAHLTQEDFERAYWVRKAIGRELTND